MREENVQRNSRKRLNALILLVAFTAILLIVATYAWFSTQRSVTLSGLTGVVNVAEGLQISLDAEKWSNSINLADNASAYFGDSGFTLQNPWTDHYNLIPSELLPVSTTGQTDEGIGEEDLIMYRGEVEGNALSDIAAVQVDTDPDSDADLPEEGYYAIDLFLQNSSASNVETDLLQLQTNSTITLSNASRYSTGLQNTLRVAFAIYDEDTAGAANTVVGSETATPANIRAATVGTGRTIQQLAIWEPNASGAQVGASPTPTTYAAHVDYIVSNNNNLTLSAADRGKFTLVSGTSKFAADEAVPTYALTKASDTANTISNIYDWDTGAAAAGLVRQYTLQTPNTGVTKAPGAKEDEGAKLVSAADGTTEITLTPGKYIHMKMYVWLEGQDVDCINYASLGGNVTLNVGLSKPAGKTAGAGG